MLFIHSAFPLYSFRFDILLQICFVTFASGCSDIFVNSPANRGKHILSLCWNALYCVYRFILSRYLFSFPSFGSNFWLFSSSCIVYFTCVGFSFLSQHAPTFYLCYIIFGCCHRFLICVSSLIFHLDFEFLFVFFWEHRFIHRLFSLLHKLVLLIAWCWLRCVLIICLFFLFFTFCLDGFPVLVSNRWLCSLLFFS